MRTRTVAAAAVLLSITVAGCSGGPAAMSEVNPSPVAGSSPALAPDVVAVVDGVSVDRAAFDTRMGTVSANADVQTAMTTQPGVREVLLSDVLTQMIEAQLIGVEASAMGVEVDDARLQTYVDEVAAAVGDGGPTAWQDFLTERGYPEAEIREQLRQDLRREMVEDRLVPTPVVDPAAVQATFDANYAGKPLVRHILVAEKTEADALLAELAAGADFAELARTRSADKASAVGGGSLGPWSEDDLAPSVDRAVETAADGAVVGPVSSPFGWHVLRREAPQTLEQVSADIEKNLREQQQDTTTTEWALQLRRAADVVVAAEFGRWDAAAGKVVR